MKKFLSCLCTAVMLAGCMITMSACDNKENDEKQSKVMNLSLNPEVEFVLDKDDKVISVNALNDEGNIIINGQTFVGKTDEEAIKLYIDVCKETGFLISGTIEAGDNQITVAFSGDDAQEAYNSVKDEIEEYFENLDITASFKKGADLTNEYLNGIVEECLAYMDEAEIRAMSYQEKLEAIAESRKETCDMYSQELKELFYQVKADAINEAKIEKAKEQLNAIDKIALGAVQTLYSTACDTLETTWNDLFIKEDSAYQTALKTFTEKKTAFLNYKNQVANMTQDQVTQAVLNQLDIIETELNTAETTLKTTKQSVQNSLNTLRATLDSKYQAVVSKLTQLNVNMTEVVNNMKTEIETKTNQCKRDFIETHSADISNANDLWSDMKSNLEGSRDR